MNIITRMLPLLIVNQARHIENINIPSCRNCVHYKPYFLNDYSSDLSKCEAFGKKNILTDEIKYDYADLCRKNKDKCGLEGKHFEEEPNVDLKIFKHQIIKNAPLYIYLLLFYLLINNNSTD